VINAVNEKKPGLFFVHGHGGTGKTFLWHTIISKIRSKGKIVLAVASSGIASLLLPGGRTAHSRFKIPLIVTNSSTCQIKKATHLARLIEKAELVVWDEAPMNHKHYFEALDKSLRDILSHVNDSNQNAPFGGKPFLLGGDFRQILPVIPGGTREEIIDASLNKFLNQLEFNGLPEHSLTLKIGMPIMLLRNLNQSSGLCNGTRLVVTQMLDRVIEAKILTGSHIGHKVFIPRIILSATENKWPFIFKRRQFPIRPCYAMTINKSQGQSLKQVGLYLPQPVFTHGQLYVALSRATSREGLKIIIDNNNEVPNKYTKNIVYKDVLQNLLSGFSFYSYMIKHSSILCNNFLCIFILTKGIYVFSSD
ncbi:unnamed protein product, partial [Prunus brigantina]